MVLQPVTSWHRQVASIWLVLPHRARQRSMEPVSMSMGSRNSATSISGAVALWMARRCSFAGDGMIDNSLIMPGAFAFIGAPVPQPNGGEVNIKVSNDVTVTGTALEPLTKAPPGILVFNGSFTSIASAAKVPDITINASSMSLSGIASIQTNRLGPGDPATVTINANTLKVENGAAVGLFNFFEGSGGNLIVNAQQVELSGNGGPTAAGATGFLAQGLFHPGFFKFSVDPRLTFADGGTITVNAPGGSLIMRGDAQITTDSFAFGRSGDVTVNARDMVLAGAGATTGAIAAQSILAGNAGNVTINASGSIKLSDGFRISANTGGSGNGGSVRVTAAEGITLTGANSRILDGTSEPTVSTLNSLFLTVFNISYDAFRANVMRNPNATLMQVLAFLNSRGYQSNGSYAGRCGHDHDKHARADHERGHQDRGVDRLGGERGRHRRECELALLE